jgi:hypothetical protein
MGRFKLLKVLAATVVVMVIGMFATGCDNGTSSGGGKDTVYINSGTKDTVYVMGDTIYIGEKDTVYLGGGGAGSKEAFSVGAWRDTTDGTYSVSLEGLDAYPFPEFWINGTKVEDIDAGLDWFDITARNISAGDLTYKIVWNGETYEKTINLPSNRYELIVDTTETEFHLSILGHNGDEKVVWEWDFNGSDYGSDTLSVNEEHVILNDNKSISRHLFIDVMHKDTKPYAAGPIDETKNFVVFEEISFWSWIKTFY